MPQNTFFGVFWGWRKILVLDFSEWDFCLESIHFEDCFITFPQKIGYVFFYLSSNIAPKFDSFGYKNLFYCILFADQMYL